MGDAGPPTPVPADDVRTPPDDPSQIRTIHVLVTGFGPFKSFVNNPSWRIAESLPTVLDPASSQAEPIAQSLGLRTPGTTPYRIRIHTHPAPIRVAYGPTAELIPALLDPARNAALLHEQAGVDFDYVLHIGLASGRDSYTLETLAHRDFYRIRDVDDGDGYVPGEKVWKAEGVPEMLEVGWDGIDVLPRWEADVKRQEWEVREDALRQRARVAMGMAEPGDLGEVKVGKAAVVKLSRDAGRFLCEFILMCALTERWRGAKKGVTEKQGKVAFLHVPNGTDVEDIARGRRVALGAIKAVVASWEAGFRNGHLRTTARKGVDVDVAQRKLTPAKVLLGGAELGLNGPADTSAFESKTTGDA